MGRALRRTSYAVDPKTGLFTEETAQIFGVPFELIPFKVEGGKPQPPTPPANHVYAETGKVAFEIEFPVVEGYQDPGIVKVMVDWDSVGELLLDPKVVPDVALLRALVAAAGSLVGYAPGNPARLNLDEWRKGVRLQQIAFQLAKVLAVKWKEERGDSIPMHRLFPQMLNAASRFIDTRVECVGTRQKQDLAINPYFGQAVAMLVNAMEVVDEGGASQERPIIARGASGIRTTATVNFHTGKAIDEEHVNKCHLNAAVFDSDWERQAAELLDKHDKVRAWVKNDRLGLAIPYRKDGGARKYLPDFVLEMTDESFLVVEIKGQEGDAAIKKAAAERWCKAVTNDGRFGSWAYSICWGPNDIMKVLAAHQV